MIRLSILKDHFVFCDKNRLNELERGNKENRRRPSPRPERERNQGLDRQAVMTGGENWCRALVGSVLNIQAVEFSAGL